MDTKKIINTLTVPNRISEGGGLSSLIIRRKASPISVIGITAAMAVGQVGMDMLSLRNAAKVGKVTYGGGPTRMTGEFTSGAVEAIHKASKGNREVFNELASQAMTDKRYPVLSAIENYGVTPEFVSALYNMGGK